MKNNEKTFEKVKCGLCVDCRYWRPESIWKPNGFCFQLSDIQEREKDSRVVTADGPVFTAATFGCVLFEQNPWTEARGD